MIFLNDYDKGCFGAAGKVQVLVAMLLSSTSML
jgi:hypothetical protein